MIHLTVTLTLTVPLILSYAQWVYDYSTEDFFYTNALQLFSCRGTTLEELVAVGKQQTFYSRALIGMTSPRQSLGPITPNPASGAQETFVNVAFSQVYLSLQYGVNINFPVC